MTNRAMRDDAHAENCPLHWVKRGTAGAKCWCNGNLTNQPAAQVSEPARQKMLGQATGNVIDVLCSLGMINPDETNDVVCEQVWDAIEAALFTTSPRYEGLVEALTHARECLKANGYGDHTVAIVMIDQALASVSIEGVGK
jgi:hypothetical protein